jgi:hypothetical protein
MKDLSRRRDIVVRYPLAEGQVFRPEDRLFVPNLENRLQLRTWRELGQVIIELHHTAHENT